jgi:hypothetical protein
MSEVRTSATPFTGAAWPGALRYVAISNMGGRAPEVLGESGPSPQDFRGR